MRELCRASPEEEEKEEADGRARARRWWVHPCHICTGTGPTPATSAPGLRAGGGAAAKPKKLDTALERLRRLAAADADADGDGDESLRRKGGSPVDPTHAVSGSELAGACGTADGGAARRRKAKVRPLPCLALPCLALPCLALPLPTGATGARRMHVRWRAPCGRVACMPCGNG